VCRFQALRANLCDFLGAPGSTRLSWRTSATVLPARSSTRSDSGCVQGSNSGNSGPKLTISPSPSIPSRGAVEWRAPASPSTHLSVWCFHASEPGVCLSVYPSSKAVESRVWRCGGTAPYE
jgi:hypothetical protein